MDESEVLNGWQNYLLADSLWNRSYKQDVSPLCPLMSFLLFTVSAFMFLCLILAVVNGESAWLAFLLSSAITFSVALALYKLPMRRFRSSLSFKQHPRKFSYLITDAQSYILTTLVWLVVPLFGSLPFWISGHAGSFVNALFESVSGFTTTGCSVLMPESLPSSLLLWRSITQWLGGLGLIMLLVLLVPGLSGTAQLLYDAEFSGTMQKKLSPRLRQTVLKLYLSYFILTLITFVVFWIIDQKPLQSLCLSMSVVSTGGFMPYNDGLTSCGNVTLLLVTVFMLFGGMNVALLYNAGRMHWHRLRHSDEWRWYMRIFVVGVVILFAFGISRNDSMYRAICGSVFAMASAVSTCGFYILDGSTPHLGASFLLLMLLFVGACSGSTGGGLKIKRLLIVVKYIRNYFIRMHHPQAVFGVKVDGQAISDEYINKVFAFLFLYFAFILLGVVTLLLCGHSLPEGIVLSASAIANAGPSAGVDILGYPYPFLSLSIPAKTVMMLLMVAGRIEIFALVAAVGGLFKYK